MREPPGAGYIAIGLVSQVIVFPVFAYIGHQAGGPFVRSAPFSDIWARWAVGGLIVVLAAAAIHHFLYVLEQRKLEVETARQRELHLARARQEERLNAEAARQHQAAAERAAEEQRKKAAAAAYVQECARAHGRFLEALAAYRVAVDFDGTMSVEELRPGFIKAYFNRQSSDEMGKLHQVALGQPASSPLNLYLPNHPALATRYGPPIILP